MPFWNPTSVADLGFGLRWEGLCQRGGREGRDWVPERPKTRKAVDQKGR